MIVVGAAENDRLMREQLQAVGVEALRLLEPVGRDTASAIAAAAGWVAQRHPDAVLVILPADHHIPDGEAFRDAVGASLASARDGAIVALGLQPRRPSTAMGYIRLGASGSDVRTMLSFVEKPDAARAQALVAEGALWNSGIFVATARTLADETERLAAEVAAATQAALHGVIVESGRARLGRAFAEAPKIAFDRAVMEHTDRGAVLPVAFAWSDLGAWDAVLEASEQDATGSSLGPGVSASNSRDLLARAAPGVELLVAGARRLVVIAEPGEVLVAGLDNAQAVRGARLEPPSDQISVLAAGGVKVAVVGAPDVAVAAFPRAVLVRAQATRRPRIEPFGSLEEASAYCSTWLYDWALPLWATAGTDPATGGFREALTWSGLPDDPRRRARVQARQTFVFASAAAAGRPGPWAELARDGFAWFRLHARGRSGLYASTLDVGGRVSEAEPRLYEQAFILLALAALEQIDPEAGRAEEAEALATELARAFSHPAGGFREAGDAPFQANAQMHLLEAALAWESAGGGEVWRRLADQLATLALTRFVDATSGALNEFFDPTWDPLQGEAALIEPGHQFEWAWLLERWGTARGREDARAAAARLFAVGRQGFDPEHGVIVNALWSDFTVRDRAARLWAQTEHLKAALILGERGAALQAANGLLPFLGTPQAGVWRERMGADGRFLQEPSPATSLYHLYLAVRELARFAGEP